MTQLILLRGTLRLIIEGAPGHFTPYKYRLSESDNRRTTKKLNYKNTKDARYKHPRPFRNNSWSQFGQPMQFLRGSIPS